MTLKITAYCGKDWVRASKAAAKVTPYTCPPVNVDTVDKVLRKATQSDVFYLNLHGYPDQPYFYGQEKGGVGPTAISVEQVKAHRWDDVVIFAEVCFSAADGGGPIARAFLECGAKAFIGSTTEAYGRVRPTVWDGEADRLMFLFWRCYALERNPAVALNQAKKWLRLLSIPLDADDRATIRSFICLTGETQDGKQND